MAAILQMTRVLETRPEMMASGIGLRHFAGDQDIESWLVLRTRAFARQRVGVGSWGTADFQREFLAKPWWRPEVMWFAELVDQPGQPPVGTITLARRDSPSGSKPVVHWLAVDPRYRRRGIGRLLLAALEQTVWDEGGRQVWLETHSAWQEATRLYEAVGYRRLGE